MTVHVDSLQQYCWWVHDVDSYWQQPSKQAVMLLSVHCIQSTHFMAPIQRCLSEQDSRHILQLQTLFVQLTFLWKHEWVQCTALASRHGVINGFVDSSECSPNTHQFLQGHRWPHLIYSTCSLMKCMHLCAFLPNWSWVGAAFTPVEFLVHSRKSIGQFVDFGIGFLYFFHMVI